MAELQVKIYREVGEEFNLNSPPQLRVILYEKLGLSPGKRTPKGQLSTDASVLEKLRDHPVVDALLDWRELDKLNSTYLEALPRLVDARDGRIHTSFNQAVAATGRLSSSNPNLQNIPVRTELGRERRKAFIASGDTVLLSADYSQIELRILAHVTADAELVQAFENDEDIHLATACTLFNREPRDVTPEMRRRAKTINFAVIYGMSDFTLAKELLMSIREAREYIETYFAKFPGVRVYTDETIEKARELGYVTTLMGRRRYIPEIASSNHNFRQFAERAAVNMPIQGTAADIMKLAMIEIDGDMRSSGVASKMLLQVHDELVFEVVPGELDPMVNLVRTGMEDAYRMRVPLRVDVKVGKNWAEMEDVPRKP
jgi:DNA polymerase-1